MRMTHRSSQGEGPEPVRITQDHLLRQSHWSLIRASQGPQEGVGDLTHVNVQHPRRG
jgi:hypothetical protein